MAFIKYNPNPLGASVGDCTVRAISLARGLSWEEAYTDLCETGFKMADMPSSNNVWGAYLINKGYRYSVIPDRCPFCYTVKDFCRDHPDGVFILGTGTHAVTVIDGDYIDAWDSGDKVPLFCYTKEV